MLSFSSFIPGPGPLAVEGQRHLGLVGQVEGQVVRALGADAGVRPGTSSRGASLKAIEMIRWPSAIRLPVRR